MQNDRQLAIGMMGRTVHFNWNGERLSGPVVGFDAWPRGKLAGSYVIVHMPRRLGSDYLAVAFTDVEELRFVSEGVEG